MHFSVDQESGYECALFGAVRPDIAPIIPIFRSVGEFQAHEPYVRRASRLRAMYKLTSPQATNNQLAFLSKPR